MGRALLLACGLLASAGAQAAAAGAPDGGGKGMLADIVADAATGMSVIARQIAQPARAGAGLVPVAAIAIALFLIWPVRRWALDRVSAFLHRSHRHTELAIYGKALASVVITTACFVLGGMIVMAGVDIGITLVPEAQALVGVAFSACILAGLGLGIGRALRSPDDKQSRPVMLPSGLGRTIQIYPFAAGAMLGLAAIVDQASRVLQASRTSLGLAHGILIVAQLLVIARFLVHAGRARARQAEAGADGEAPSIPAVFGVTAIAWGALAVAVGALLLGHGRFAMLLLQEMLWAALILTTAWLLTRFLDALVGRLLGSGQAAGRFATGVVGVREARLQQGALLINALFSVVIWLLALFLVLAPIQGGGDNVVEQVRPSPLLAALGSATLSPRTLLTAIAVLVGGIMATRMLRGWLDRRFLPSTNLDVGARTSIVTGLGYVGIIVALLATSSTLGLQLEKITLIASALTVGIGFGLQAIIQNFVSGVILLFERPIQIGDWVSVTGSEGRVRRMRVRATEVVADDGSIAIVPNSAFISSTVLNRSGAVDRASFDVTIKVSGCASAHEAKDLLRDRIDGCAAIRSDPPPRFYLESLGENAWTFRVRMQGATDASQAGTTSELLFHLSMLDHPTATITVA